MEKRFEKILADIKSVKIQGAENVARAGVEAFLIRPDKKSAKKIISLRPTEPLLQNAIHILLKSKDYRGGAKEFLKDLEMSHDAMVRFGSKLIKNDMNIYSHCHSSSVIDILKYARKKEGKNFVVYTTEVEPLLQGRKTAVDLAKEGIKVIVFPDLAMEVAMKKCDLFLFGSDAFTPRYVVNKIGTGTLCEIAKRYGVRSFSCGVSMKFTKRVKIEKRNGREVWDERRKLVIVENPAFDKTKWKKVSGVISEFGVLSSREFLREARRKVLEVLRG